MKSRGIEVAESSDEEVETPGKNPNPFLESFLVSPRQSRAQAPTSQRPANDKGQEHQGRELVIKLKLKVNFDGQSVSVKNHPIPTSMQVMSIFPEIKKSLKSSKTAETVEAYEREIFEEFAAASSQELASTTLKLRQEKYGVKST